MVTLLSFCTVFCLAIHQPTSDCMNRCRRTFYLFLILFCCHQNNLSAQVSYEWFKGWWQPYNVTPDSIRGQKIESDLEITSLIGDHYAGIQKIWCANDTTAMVKRECSGTFTNGDFTFLPGKETWRKEPQEAYIWNAYTKYTVEKTWFSISERKLLLHIKAKSEQADFVKEFTYYRDITTLPFSLRANIQKRYGSPQLVDETDTVKVIKPMEPDMDDTTFYTNTISIGKDLPPDIVARKNTLVKTLDVSSPDVQIILLDDAEIDGDVISLYHNNELVLNHKTIGKEMVRYALKADAEHPHHEFTLVAENLGSIPPNTALVRIRAGEMKYEFVVHSDMQENVKFVINYVGDKKIDITAPKK